MLSFKISFSYSVYSVRKTEVVCLLALKNRPIRMPSPKLHSAPLIWDCRIQKVNYRIWEVLTRNMAYKPVNISLGSCHHMAVYQYSLLPCCWQFVFALFCPCFCHFLQSCSVTFVFCSVVLARCIVCFFLLCNLLWFCCCPCLCRAFTENDMPSIMISVWHTCSNVRSYAQSLRNKLDKWINTNKISNHNQLIKWFIGLTQNVAVFIM